MVAIDVGVGPQSPVDVHTAAEGIRHDVGDVFLVLLLEGTFSHRSLHDSIFFSR